jgi:peptidoglycan hydrolase-like protein with peptidoglycan-binding domain
VVSLQCRLSGLHDDVGPVDGQFGSQTFHAVVAFQKINGLTRAGAVLKVYDASSGRASTPTPTGNFTVIRQIDGWRRSSLGLLWRANYFFRGFAVRGSKSVPAFPASHGCVRVSIESMNRLWSIMRVGMPVSLYR